MTPVSCMYLYRVADEGVVEAVPVSGPRETDIVVRVEPDLHRGPANIEIGKVLEFGHKKSNFPHMGWLFLEISFFGSLQGNIFRKSFARKTLEKVIIDNLVLVLTYIIN